MENKNKATNPYFGSILKKLRNEKGLTQTDIGKITHKGDSTVRMWELRNSEPDYETIIKIADYFNVTIDYLLGRDHITPEECAAGWVSTKKANLTPQEDEWLAKRSQILNLYGEEGLKTVSAMINAYISAKTDSNKQ